MNVEAIDAALEKVGHDFPCLATLVRDAVAGNA